MSVEIKETLWAMTPIGIERSTLNGNNDVANIG